MLRTPAMRVIVFMAIFLAFVTIIIQVLDISPFNFGRATSFNVKLTERNLALLISALDAFDSAMRQADVPFFLYSGSLLGSWRHHGLVPWDDDVDFVVPDDLKGKVYQVLGQLRPNFNLSTEQEVRWKLYSKMAHPIPDFNWSWPFVDISFYKENATHLWDSDEDYFPNFTFHKTDVFPLSERPFQGRLLPAPKNCSAVLAKTYRLDECSENNYDHRNERRVENWTSKDCKDLITLFPFVNRTKVSGGCRETLWLNGAVWSTTFASEVVC